MADPAASLNVAIRRLGPADAPLLQRAGSDVFDDAVDPARSAEFLADPRHHLMAAIAGERIVGMALAVHYVHPDKAPELWINEVSVAASHRRRGIGLALMRALLEHGRTLGCTGAWLGTDAANTAARALYRAAGGHEAPMVCVVFPL